MYSTGLLLLVKFLISTTIRLFLAVLLMITPTGLHTCLEHTQKSVAAGTRLYAGKSMRGSVASQAAAVDEVIPWTGLCFTIFLNGAFTVGVMVD